MKRNLNCCGNCDHWNLQNSKELLPIFKGKKCRIGACLELPLLKVSESPGFKTENGITKVQFETDKSIKYTFDHFSCDNHYKK
jgi:hypothetical protein